MRVAFLANKYLDPRRAASWSGLPFFIRRALEDAGIDTWLVWCHESHRAACWLQFVYWRLWHRRRYLRYCHEGLLRGYARQIERRLAAGPPTDAVFSVSTWLLAFLRTELPTVLYADACFRAMLGFYESFSNLAPASVRAGHRVERLALSRCRRIIYPTHWAARAAQEFYHVDPAKISVVFYGGGFHEPPNPAEIADEIRRRALDPCRLLLVGVDWKRKGADIAVQAVEAIQAQGGRVRLTVVGCRPPPSPPLPPGVEVVPFIDKQSEEGRLQLDRLFRQSHFFILPSRAEAAGIVLSEAAAYGLPCLVTDTGGISSNVLNGCNGRVFSPAATGRDYAEYVLRMMKNVPRYRALARRSLEESVNRLSWKVSGPRLAEILNEIVPGPDRPRPVAAPTTGR
jgi:glycosyltransferase involved in cell wall biosynthesis